MVAMFSPVVPPAAALMAANQLILRNSFSFDGLRTAQSERLPRPRCRAFGVRRGLGVQLAACLRRRLPRTPNLWLRRPLLLPRTDAERPWFHDWTQLAAGTLLTL